MDAIATVSVRLELAADLAAIIGAACEAFEDMLPALHDQQDRAGGAFTTFVMSAVAAARKGVVAFIHRATPPSHPACHAIAGPAPSFAQGPASWQRPRSSREPFYCAR